MGSAYWVMGGLRWKEQERPDDIAYAICNEQHSADNALLGKASHVGVDHGQVDGNAGGVGNEYPESEKLAPLVRAVADEDASYETGISISELFFHERMEQ